jgi:hypothetical protein
MQLNGEAFNDFHTRARRKLAGRNLKLSSFAHCVFGGMASVTERKRLKNGFNDFQVRRIQITYFFVCSSFLFY